MPPFFILATTACAAAALPAFYTFLALFFIIFMHAFALTFI
jgi:hypothetical protein